MDIPSRSLAISLGLAVLLWASAVAAQDRHVPVRTELVAIEEVQQTQRVIGSLRAVSRAQVAALEDGRVVTVSVREGARVATGEVLARLDDRRLRAQIAESEATLKATQAMIDQRRAELAKANQDYKRADQLIQRRVVSQQEYDHAEADASVARARLTAAERERTQIESQRRLLQVRLDDTTIAAPFDGYVVERHVEPGEWVRPGDPLVTLVSAGTIEAWFEVPERFASDVAPSATSITVEVPAVDQSIDVRQGKRIRQMDPRARTFFVVAEINDQAGLLTPGMSASAWLPVGPRSAQLTVPSDAVIRDAANAFVYKVQQDRGDAYAVRVPVRVLFQVAGKVAVVTEDLSPNDHVVIEGNERLLPGMKVALIPPALDQGVSRTVRLSPRSSDQRPTSRPARPTEPSTTNHPQ
jgi:RND family efflux transporter MFP subunit